MQFREVERLDPVASIVEDEDGQRALLIMAPTPDPFVPEHLVARGQAAGVVMFIIADVAGPDGDDQQVTVAPWDQSGRWYEMQADQVSYRALVEAMAAEDSQPVVDPLDSSEFVHLHTHTEFSLLDGLSKVDEAVEVIVAQGGGALGSADHGNCAVHPALQAECDKAGIKAVFGMEAYFVPDRHRRVKHWYELNDVEVEFSSLSDTDKKKAKKVSDATEVKAEYTHLSLWAVDDVGLRNLWAMSTEAYRTGLYDGNPRLDWEVLERYFEGIACGTGCLRGPVSRPIVQDNEDEARMNLLRLHEIFGDRLYMEIHCNSLDDQVKVNHVLQRWCTDYRIQPLACVDSHYAYPEHEVIHRAWVAMQLQKSLVDDTTMFQGRQQYHLKTPREVWDGLAAQGLSELFIKASMTNTVDLARQCTARVEGEVTTPVYSKVSEEHPDPVQRDVERLLDLCLEAWPRRYRGSTVPYEVQEARFEREMALLISKGFCGYYLITQDYVSWAKREGCLVGPGRGSGGGSMVAYLAGISETEPIANGLLFERFLTEGRTSLPDFDIDFPASWRERIKAYVSRRWGEENVATIGTVVRLQSKGAINDVNRVLKGTVEEIPYLQLEGLKKSVDAADAPLAGKHLPWEEFCAQHEDIVEPMKAAHPEHFQMIDTVIQRVKSYGKHPSGVVLSSGRSLSDLPMRLEVDRKSGTEMMVTQFDMNALELLGYVKFDLLTLRTLDTIQACVDLVAEQFGRRINPYDWIEEYFDPYVWAEIAEGRTLGLFQIETRAGTRLVKKFQPSSLGDLAAINTLVRPGPTNSGLTKSYLARRAGLEQVTYPHPQMEPHLSDTYGTMIYQEQVMATCMVLAGYDSTKADEVRSLLGKKKVEKVQAAGNEFVAGATGLGLITEAEAVSLWGLMAEFARYSFNKAHAYSYAVLGYICAWFKFHFPVQFLVAVLSTVKAERMAEFITECRRMGYGVKAPDVNLSQVGFSAQGMDIRYGLANVKGIGDPTAAAIVSGAPYTDLADFTARMVTEPSTPVDAGHLKILVAVGAFDSLVDNRRAVEIQLEAEASGEAKRCVHKTDGVLNFVGLPCTFDWDNEVDPPLVVKGRGKARTTVVKPPPKRCSVSCRNYTKPTPQDPAFIEPYTDDDVRAKEKELLGVWISSSPFDRVPAEYREGAQSLEEIEAGPIDQPYVSVVLVDTVKVRVDRSGNSYAWVTFGFEDGLVDAICFASKWTDYQPWLNKDALGAVVLNKNARGLNLDSFTPI